MFARTLIMFEYEGLPETIPAKAFESQLQKQGFSFVTEVKGELYCFTGGLGGELDEYYEPTQIVIANPWLDFNETLDLKKDGVLCANDEKRQGLLPLFEKYHSLMIENDITMTLNSFNNRVQTLISAGDDATRESAEIYLDKVKAGEQGVIAEQRIFDGISVHNAQSNLSSTTMALTEFHQYLKASLYNELGLDANFNMKRERLTAGEVAQNDEGLYPLVTNMLYNRRKAVNEINEKYGTNITVTFGSVWKNRNLAGEMNQDMMLGHTEDMDAGQSDLELLAMLDAMLAEEEIAVPEDTTAPIEAPVEDTTVKEVPEEPLQGPEEVLEEEVPKGIQLSEKALETDLDDLPDEDRLEIYDLIFGIEDEEVEPEEVAERIADILESHVEGAEDNESEEETAGETEPDEEQAEPETETEKAGPTEEAGRAEEEGTGEEEESREQEEEGSSEEAGSSEEDEVEEPEDGPEEPEEIETTENEPTDQTKESQEEEAETEPEEEAEAEEQLAEPEYEVEVAEIIAEAVEEVIEVIEEEEEEEGEED